jgi:hypothetical protein
VVRDTAARRRRRATGAHIVPEDAMLRFCYGNFTKSWLKEFETSPSQREVTDLYNPVTKHLPRKMHALAAPTICGGSHLWRCSPSQPALNRIWTSSGWLSSYFSSAREIFWTTSFSLFFLANTTTRSSASELQVRAQA